MKATRPTRTPRAKKTNATISQITPHTGKEVSRWKRPERVLSPRAGKHPQIFAKADASDSFTLRAIVSSITVGQSGLQNYDIYDRRVPMTSQRTYMHDMTPTNNTLPQKKKHEWCVSENKNATLTKNRSASPRATNQNSSIIPDIPNIRNHVLVEH